jgi:uncharacterized membrane protein YkoI
MKLHRKITILAVLAAITGFTASALAGEEKEESISLDQVPQSVKDTLKQYAADSDVKTVVKGDQDGTKVFEFDIEQGARKFEVAISTKGKFMGTEEDVQLSDMPQPAQDALKAQGGDGKLSGFEKAVDQNNKATYEADIEKDGKKSEVAVDADGKVVSTEAAGAEKD